MSYKHDHNWRLIETKTAFEPFTDHELSELYLRIEWAILACGCGEVMKRRIKSADEVLD